MFVLKRWGRGLGSSSGCLTANYKAHSAPRAQHWGFKAFLSASPLCPTGSVVPARLCASRQVPNFGLPGRSPRHFSVPSASLPSKFFPCTWSQLPQLPDISGAGLRPESPRGGSGPTATCARGLRAPRLRSREKRLWGGASVRR